MRYLVIIFCILLSVNFLIGEVYNAGKLDNNIRNRERAIIENDSSNPIRLMEPSPAPTYVSRDDIFSPVLVDSSKNGYGLYSQSTTPIEYIPGLGVAACYRQWQGADVSAGYIGTAQSPDGINWMVSSAINSVYPYGATPDTDPAFPGQPQGRYPSLGGSINGYPTPIWTEYTTTTGGGTNGGRAMYTYDQLGWFGSSFASPIFDLNNGCNPTPCDPPDLWVSQSLIVEDATGPILLTGFQEGLANNNYWLIRSNLHMFGYYFMSDPVLIHDELAFHIDGYTGDPEFHINSDGTGYLGVVGYWHDYQTGGAVTTHTLFYKTTTDYGLTWSITGGLENSGFNHISDAKLLELYTEATAGMDVLVPGDTMIYSDPDTMIINNLFIGYDYDLKVDADGGLHLVAQCILQGELFSDGSSGVESRYSGAGIYHFYNPTPDTSENWTASFVRDMWLSNRFDYGIAGAGFTGYQYHSPDLAISSDPGSQTLWCVIPAVTDSSELCPDLYCDIDLFLSKSEDNGATWIDLGNLTNTPIVDGIKNYEVSSHIAPIATDSGCYFMWQVADFSLLTVETNEYFEDYKQRVYVGNYGLETVVEVDADLQPNRFTLNQNYPNPFNPTTRIEYSLATAGNVTLTLYNIMGQKVLTMVDKYLKAGSHDFVLDASELPSGIYFYSLTQNGNTKSNKLVLMK